MNTPAVIVLEDGREFRGRSFGASGEIVAEMVFNTSMTGYQEILTDPSYAGQAVCMTYPHIGNYGTNPEDVESDKPHAVALIVREACWTPSNYRSTESLPDYLKRNGVIGIEGIDTRALTRHLRLHGAMMGTLSTELGMGDGGGEIDIVSLHEKAKSAPSMEGSDLATGVSCSEPFTWTDIGLIEEDREAPGAGLNIVVLDCGVKRSILRQLAALGCELTTVPITTSAETILAMSPDGVLISNGPGDPAACTGAIACVKELIGKVPILGICLGHQILGLALGGRTYKMKFGHRGGNHPVKELSTDDVLITSHNHGFAVDLDSLKDKGIIATFVNLNDHTLEGFRHEELPVWAIQFHPEAAPGPHDAAHLFRDWIRETQNLKATSNNPVAAS